ncbi:type I secretion C-terminal target domain-containing protein [Bartonella sp. HY038]|uniref:beta strand repeat-containing protein n=1 Tax=Bartonella sp. HY038 TaxID=2759660 RepID=UPI0015F99B72|nr:type I secretion C-terminal target domain-containing protein [Bartonella sp. HY038]
MVRRFLSPVASTTPAASPSPMSTRNISTYSNSFTYKGHSDPDGVLKSGLFISTKPILWYSVTNVGPAEYPVAIGINAQGQDVLINGVLDQATGLWKFDFAAAGAVLKTGSNSITFVIGGTPGNNNEPVTDDFQVLADPTATATIESFTDNVGSVTGNLPSGSQTDDRTITLNGKVSSDFFQAPANGANKLAIYQDGHLVGYATVNANGTWSYTVPSALENSPPVHNFTAVVENAATLTGTPSANFVVDVHLTIGVESLSTEDTTPVLNGSIGFELLSGEYITVTINGKTYSSASGQVVVNQANMTWSVTIPNQDALGEGNYPIVAALHKSTGEIIVSNSGQADIIEAAPPIDDFTIAASQTEHAVAMTLGENGQWKIFANGTVLDQKATNNSSFGEFSQIVLNSIDGRTGKQGTKNGTWLDINRDGKMDFVATDGNGANGAQIYMKANTPYSTTGYYNYQVGGSNRNTADFNPAANTMSEYGGVVGFDRNGNGYSDIAYGTITPGKSGSVRNTTGAGQSLTTYNSQIVTNPNASLNGMVKDKNFVDTNGRNAQAGAEISGVDLNNDGTVDLVYHGVNGANVTTSGAMSSNQQRLVVVSNNGNGTYGTKQIIENVFQNNASANAALGNAISMTWADFNGDGNMDLFLGRGAAVNGHSAYESRILFNDGNGNLGSTSPNGVGTANNVHWLGDSLQSGASIAVDWDGDGKMDIIALPGYGNGNGMTEAGNTGAINLHRNVSLNGVINFETSNLLGGNNTIGVNGTVNNGSSTGSKKDFVTGAIAADLDWNGSVDLMAFTQQGHVEVIQNKNVIANGTALHFRILDGQGINSLLGNTVQLYDSTGKLVAAQIINPQSGNQTSDTSGIVHFYGLDSNETYSVKILRNVNGSSAHISEDNNAAWGGFTPGAANEAHVLTTERGTDVNNANIGNGVVGTGYNDTFYVTKGTKLYDGAGGWDIINGQKQWSATGGVDIVDFKLAGNTALNVDLSKTGYQNTGFNTVMLKNIEGIAGGNGNDTFSGNSGNNVFNGRGGNDTFNLFNSNHHTLLYERIDMTDATGGNGNDIANGFTVGNFNTNANADRIDFSGLLIGYQAGTSNISDFISVRQQGSNTVISVDLDGNGNQFASADILTLTNVQTDLNTLIQNQQIIV